MNTTHEESPTNVGEASSRRIGSVYSDSIPEARAMDFFLQPAGWWADHGFAVLPLKKYAKRPNSELLGKFGSFESIATTDLRQVEEWWREEVWKSNVGVATGEPSGVVVIDIDGPEGYEALREWEFENDCYLPGTFTVKTPSGGLHYWFELPEGSERVPSPTGWLPKVDVRADGAMVVAPPSVLLIDTYLAPRPGDPKKKTGAQYTQYIPYKVQSGHPTRLATAPDALLADIRRSPGRSTSHFPASDLPETERLIETGLPVGSRNETMHRLACRLFRRYGFLKVPLVYAICRRVWERTPDHHSFTWAEAENAVLSAENFMRREMNKENQA